MSKSVLVTGATGFVGQAAVATLVAGGWNVTLAVRNSLCSQKGPATCTRVTLDLRRPADILALAEHGPFDAIVHLGTRVGFSGETDADLYGPNVLATALLAHLAVLWQAHFIFASGTLVHGNAKETIDLEPITVCPVMPYAKSKWLGEKLIEASQIQSCILRIGGIYGASGPAHLGINRAIDAALKGEVPTQIGSGDALRNYIYVKDAANAIVFALENKLEGVHLIAAHDILSISEMLQGICDIFLPASSPQMKPGADAVNQVVKPSLQFPKTRTFRSALLDIKAEYQR